MLIVTDDQRQDRPTACRPGPTRLDQSVAPVVTAFHQPLTPVGVALHQTQGGESGGSQSRGKCRSVQTGKASYCAKNGLSVTARPSSTDDSSKKSKHLERGIAFPTCISVNHVMGHYSPLVDESSTLEDGDVAKM